MAAWVAAAIVLCGALLPVGSWAQDIREAFARAQATDPTYLQAVANLEVAQSRRGQARAQLLPQLGISGTSNWNDRRYDTHGSIFPPTNSQYNSTSAQVTLTESLWRHPYLIGAHQASVLVNAAQYQQAAAAQDLAVRLLQAWFDLMASTDQVGAANKAVSAAENEWQAVHRSSELSLASQPEEAEAFARLEMARADLIASQGEAAAKRAALEEILGPGLDWEPPRLAEPPAGFLLEAQPLTWWLERVERASPTIVAARETLEAARAQVRKEQAGHEPTVDLVATYGRNNQGDGNFPGQLGYDIRQKTIGVQVNIPLYAGGGVRARVREALAEQGRALQQLNAAIRTSRTQVTVAWNQLAAARARQAAARQAVKSAAVSLERARQGRSGGVKADIDVLKADTQAALAQRDLNRANYDLVLNSARLKAGTADFSAQDIDRLAGLFVARAASPPNPPDAP